MVSSSQNLITETSHGPGKGSSFILNLGHVCHAVDNTKLSISGYPVSQSQEVNTTPTTVQLSSGIVEVLSIHDEEHRLPSRERSPPRLPWHTTPPTCRSRRPASKRPGHSA